MSSDPDMSGTGPTVPSWPPPGEGQGPDQAPQVPDGYPPLGGGPGPDEQAGAAPQARGTRAPNLTRVAISVLIAVAIVAIPLVLISHQASKYFLFSPGSAPLVTTSSRCAAQGSDLELPDGQPCVRLELPKAKQHSVNGKLFMVDVELSTPSAWQWVEGKLGLLGKSRQLVPVADYLGPTPTQELGCQDELQMSSANQDAALAALSHLGYKVTNMPVGAQLYAVFGGSPAWDAGLQCNDMITAVDGKKVTTDSQLTSDLSGMKPGTTVSLTDVPSSGGPAKVYRVKLAPPPAEIGGQKFIGTSYLGVELDTGYRPKLPFPVSVDAGAIGGPSAGLAFTLAILDSLSNGRLTGGHAIAATGEIDAQGDVSAVGGVQEKTVAVEHAGAQVFFVPQSDYTSAMATADKKITVIPVSSLSQVLQILHSRYGGDLSGISVSPLS